MLSDVPSARKLGRPPTQRARAESFLKLWLEGGPRHASVLADVQVALGISEKTFDRARARLGIRAEPIMVRRFPAITGWRLHLPRQSGEHDQEEDRHVPSTASQAAQAEPAEPTTNAEEAIRARPRERRDDPAEPSTDTGRQLHRVAAELVPRPRPRPTPVTSRRRRAMTDRLLDPLDESRDRAKSIVEECRTELLRPQPIDDRDAIDPYIRATDPETGTEYRGYLSGAPAWAKQRAGYLPLSGDAA